MTIRGGSRYQNQSTKYDISDGTFTDYGEDYLSSILNNSDGEYGTGVYFTQINTTTLYTINQNGDSINVYDLPSFSYRDLGVSIPINVEDRGCLSSSLMPSPTLYITGGPGSLDAFQILNLDTMEWTTSHKTLPSLTYGRDNHGCIVANHSLWVIGGQNVDSVEAINITDITTEKWVVIGNLNCELRKFGVTAVDHLHLIFVAGGYCSDANNSALSDVVYTIDTVDQSISVYGDTLPYPVEAMPVLAIGNTIYGFGGYSYSGFGGFSYSILDSWMTLTLLCLPL